MPQRSRCKNFPRGQLSQAANHLMGYHFHSELHSCVNSSGSEASILDSEGLDLLSTFRDVATLSRVLAFQQRYIQLPQESQRLPFLASFGSILTALFLRVIHYHSVLGPSLTWFAPACRDVCSYLRRHRSSILPPISTFKRRETHCKTPTASSLIIAVTELIRQT